MAEGGKQNISKKHLTWFKIIVKKTNMNRKFLTVNAYTTKLLAVLPLVVLCAPVGNTVG